MKSFSSITSDLDDYILRMFGVIRLSSGSGWMRGNVDVGISIGGR